MIWRQIWTEIRLTLAMELMGAAARLAPLDHPEGRAIHEGVYHASSAVIVAAAAQRTKGVA